mgnify:CR=1 FL=1
MTKERKLLDRKDLDIIDILDKFRSRVSTKQLSDILHIPERTVRFRLDRMRRRGFLQPLHVLTHERKLGLGEIILVIQERQKNVLTKKLLDKIPYFYRYSATCGKYNGYLVNSVFSLDAPNTIFELVRAMQKSSLISDFYIFEIVDYEVKNMNLAYWSPEKGWTWNWDDWINGIEENLQKNEKINIPMSERPTVVDFDAKDIGILKHMISNAKITSKQLGEILSLSEAQVSRRIQRLEREGVIKGYKSVFNPTSTDKLISFYCFFELENLSDKVLSCFYLLPYSFDLLMESRKKFCLRLSLSASDFNGFLRGFQLIKLHLDTYCFQIVQPSAVSRAQEVYNLFSTDEKTWKTPVEEYITDIEHFAA